MVVPVKKSVKKVQTLKEYNLKNLLVCPELKKEFENIAVRRILGDLVKIILSAETKELVQERRRMDIPYGFFGLKLDDFYERRRIDPLYIDVLSMSCKESLHNVKVCIVLDDLRDYIKRLTTAYTSNNMGRVVQDIANSYKLLTIHETIVESYVENREKVEVNTSKLKEYSLHKIGVLNKMDGLIFAAMNKLTETILIINKLEHRTYVNFLERNVDQYVYDLTKAEKDIQNTLNNISSMQVNESLVSDSVLRRQDDEITFLKKKIKLESDKYDSQNEYFDGRLAYNKNSMELMKKRMVDCSLRLAFFATEMPKLIQWDEEREERERAKAMELITRSLKPKRGKKDAKEKLKEQKLTNLSTAISTKLDEIKKKEIRKKEVAKRLKL